VPGVKKVMVASGVRYDLAVRESAYVNELVTHHVGGLSQDRTGTQPKTGPLSKMMKPGIGTYDRFKAIVRRGTPGKPGKKYFLIPYFIAAHPVRPTRTCSISPSGSEQPTIEPNQVQTFLPSPMAVATAHVPFPASIRCAACDMAGPRLSKPSRACASGRLHKAFLRYHAPEKAENWPAAARRTLKRMGRADLIGPGKHSNWCRNWAAGPGRQQRRRRAADRTQAQCAEEVHHQGAQSGASQGAFRVIGSVMR